MNKEQEQFWKSDKAENKSALETIMESGRWDK